MSPFVVVLFAVCDSLQNNNQIKTTNKQQTSPWLSPVPSLLASILLVAYRRGMPASPAKCWGIKVTFTPINVDQRERDYVNITTTTKPPYS